MCGGVCVCFECARKVSNTNEFVSAHVGVGVGMLRNREGYLPQQQTFLGCHFLHANTLDLVVENDSPDHTQNHLHNCTHTRHTRVHKQNRVSARSYWTNEEVGAKRTFSPIVCTFKSWSAKWTPFKKLVLIWAFSTICKAKAMLSNLCGLILGACAQIQLRMIETKELHLPCCAWGFQLSTKS